jgi:hypothetical protein
MVGGRAAGSQYLDATSGIGGRRGNDGGEVGERDVVGSRNR